MKTEDDYKAEAKKRIKLAMVENDWSYRDLAIRLGYGTADEMGKDFAGALRNKVSRGAFSAAFFLMILDIMDNERPRKV